MGVTSQTFPVTSIVHSHVNKGATSELKWSLSQSVVTGVWPLWSPDSLDESTVQLRALASWSLCRACPSSLLMCTCTRWIQSISFFQKLNGRT